jgi:hypothetical protein
MPKPQYLFTISDKLDHSIYLSSGIIPKIILHMFSSHILNFDGNSTIDFKNVLKTKIGTNFLSKMRYFNV